MRNVVFTSFIIGLFSFCYQPNATRNEYPTDGKAGERPSRMVVPDSLTYGFINQVINDGSDKMFICEKLADKALIGFTTADVDSVRLDSLGFSQRDINFIQKQLSVVQFFKLNPKLVEGKTLIPTDTLKTFIKKRQGSFGFWSSYRKHYGEGGFCSVSMPLFSKDTRTVIFQKSHQCEGECGGGGTYIFKKINGKWTIVKELSSWIS